MSRRLAGRPSRYPLSLARRVVVSIGCWATPALLGLLLAILLLPNSTIVPLTTP